MRKKWGIPILLFSLLFFTLSPAAGIASDRYRPGSLYQTFQQAADEFEVPVEILLAVSYVETRWQDHKGKPSQLNGYGLMHLADNPSNQSLKEASRLLGIPESTLKKNIKQNIRGGAAVLAKLGEETQRRDESEQPGRLVCARRGIQRTVLGNRRQMVRG